MQRGLRIQINQGGIARAGLKQQALATIAPRFDIHDHAGARDVGAITGIGRTAQQTLFLAIGEQRDHRVTGRPGPVRLGMSLESANGFQDDSDARTIIGSTGAARHGIGVRHQKHFLTGAGQHLGADVRDGAASLPLAAAIAALLRMLFIRHVKPGEFGLEPVTKRGRLRRTAGMGHFRPQQLLEIAVGIRGEEAPHHRIRV